MPVVTLEVSSNEPVCLEKASFDVVAASQTIASLCNLNPEGAEAQTFLYMNLAAKRSEEKKAAVLPLELTEEFEQIINLLSVRGFIFMNGRCILNSSIKKDVQEFAEYAEAHGLVEPNSINRVFWVSDSSDYASSFQAIAEVASVSERPVRIEPYQYTALLREITRETGASLSASADELISKLADQFSSKIAYCDFIEELFPGQIPFPRLSFEPGKLTEQDIVHRLQDLLDYSNRYTEHDFDNDGPKKLIFMRAATGAGGFGNNIVSIDSDGRMFTRESTDQPRIYFENSVELARFIVERGIDTEITPFVNVRNQKTYSFGIMITDTAVTVTGPREQVLNAEGAFQGWRRDIGLDSDGNGICEKLVNFDAEMKKSLMIGLKLYEMGYRGNLSRDMFEFIDPNGNKLVTDAEVNARRDGTGFFLGVLARMGLLENFLNGDVSVITNDHFKLSKSLESETPAVLADYFSKNGVKMMTEDEPYGVAMLTPPSKKGEIAIGICARSDEERDHYYRLMNDLMEEKPDKLVEVVA